MRYLFLIILSVLSFFLQPETAHAQFQPAPVEKSNEKILLQGKVYYMHTVKAGQTLYSISKAYETDIQLIKTANPEANLDVLSTGQVLRIPDQTTTMKSEATAPQTIPADSNFLYHRVSKKETVHTIAKNYGVSKEAIYLHNPGSETSIQINQVLKIPITRNVITSSTLPTIGSNQYLVQDGDSLFLIAQRFEIEMDELVKINPALRWGLKPGMVIYISSADSLIAMAEPDSSLLVDHSIRQYKSPVCDSIQKASKVKTIKIALLLPFHAEEMIALESEPADSLKRKNPSYRFKARSNGASEYYQGFLLAVDSLKRKGVSVSIFTYDTKSDTQRVKSILTELDIIKPEIIFGPLISENVKLVSEYSETNKIPLVLPFYKVSDNNIRTSPFSLYMIPDRKSEIENCADYLSQFKEKKIIILHHQLSADSLQVKELKENIFAYSLARGFYETIDYKEIAINDTLEKGLRKELVSTKGNIVVILSNREANVSNLIGILNIYQSRGMDIDVIGIPEWLTFENLRIELLHQLNTVIYSPFFIDYKNLHTQSFIKNCRKTLGYEPQQVLNSNIPYNFTFLGYESGLLFMDVFSQYGPSLLNCVCQVKGNMPQSQYQFKLIQDKGFANTSINFINYNTSYEVERISFESLQEMNSKKNMDSPQLPASYKPSKP
ncbi:MAG: LysM peptidoglycan-binding domain-containing protein [Bacteroidota bacterium]|nr:MAG: LysM peptidoglycan-binding domain-containing protein [Bacteroidota bacterium]